MDYKVTSIFLKEGIPLSKVESPHLARMVKLAKATTSDYKLPNWKKIGSEIWKFATSNNMILSLLSSIPKLTFLGL